MISVIYEQNFPNKPLNQDGKKYFFLSSSLLQMCLILETLFVLIRTTPNLRINPKLDASVLDIKTIHSRLLLLLCC